jgi:Phage tail lysozyme
VTQYYTYKVEVPLLPGQTLGYTPGKGYYAKGTPTPSQATKQTTGFNEAAVSSATAYAPPAPATEARTARQTYEFDEAAVSVATAYPEPAPATEARTARQTYEFDEAAVSSAAVIAESPATKARTARQTYEFDETSVGSAATQAQPQQADAARTARQTYEFDEATVSDATQPRDSNASKPALDTTGANPVQPSSAGTPIPSADRELSAAQQSPQLTRRDLLPIVRQRQPSDAHERAQWDTTEQRMLYAFYYLKGALGLSDIQAAALVGNFATESYAYRSPGQPRLAPWLEQYEGPAAGIAQWEPGTPETPSRLDALKFFANDQNMGWRNFGVQLVFVVLELKIGVYSEPDGTPIYLLRYQNVLSDLRKQTTLAGAIAHVGQKYETANAQAFENSKSDRMEQALVVLKLVRAQ